MRIEDLTIGMKCQIVKVSEDEDEYKVGDIVTVNEEGSLFPYCITEEDVTVICNVSELEPYVPEPEIKSVITFQAEDPNPLKETFKDIAIDQFFEDNEGYLCQKVDWESYIVLADSSGYPDANWHTDISRDMKVKYLPHVERITWK